MLAARVPACPTATCFPGRVEGDYAVWTQCTPVAKLCSSVSPPDLDTGDDRVPQPVSGKINYARPVTSNGDVYYARGAWGCGANVQLRRYSGAGDALIWQMNPGVDLETTTATWVSPAGAVHFMFSRTPCGSAPRWDIYEVIDP